MLIFILELNIFFILLAFFVLRCVLGSVFEYLRSSQGEISQGATSIDTIDRAIKVAHVAGISSPFLEPRSSLSRVYGERVSCAEIITRGN